MNDLTLAIILALGLVLTGFWTRQRIARGVDHEVEFIDGEFETSTGSSIFRTLSVHSRTTLMFLAAAIFLVIGCLRYFGVIT